MRLKVSSRSFNLIFIQLSLFIFQTDALFAISFFSKKKQYSKIRISSARKFFDNFHTVQKDALYRCKQLPAYRLKKYVKKNNIKTIINLRGKNKDKKWWQEEKQLTQELGLNYHNIPMNSRRLSKRNELVELLYLYKIAPKPILIHCLGGIDRTGEAAALWVLEMQKKPKKYAFKHLSWRYGYLRFRKPAKHFLVKMWDGVGWLINHYSPEKYLKFS